MATTVATTGFGTLLKAGDGTSSETFTAITEVKSISGPGISAELADATHMESPSNYREFITSLLDSGEISLEVNFLPNTSGQTVVTTDLAAQTKRNFQLVFPNSAATTWSFAGYYTNFSPSAVVDDVLSASITIKVTGAVTIS